MIALGVSPRSQGLQYLDSRSDDYRLGSRYDFIVEHKAFVKFDLMSSQHLQVFFTERLTAMMLNLTIDVAFNGFGHRLAH